VAARIDELELEVLGGREGRGAGSIRRRTPEYAVAKEEDVLSGGVPDRRPELEAGPHSLRRRVVSDPLRRAAGDRHDVDIIVG
jgi:hypothetical protein